MANVRGARAKPLRRVDSYGENRRAWVMLHNSQVVYYRNPTQDDDETTSLGDDIDTLGLTFFKNGRTAITFGLTAMTEAELDALKKVIDMAFSEARPLAAELDRRAELARQKGNDSLVRLYRAVPEVHVRERQQSGDDPSLQERHPGVPDDVSGLQPGEPPAPSDGGTVQGVPQPQP